MNGREQELYDAWRTESPFEEGEWKPSNCRWCGEPTNEWGDCEICAED